MLRHVSFIILLGVLAACGSESGDRPAPADLVLFNATVHTVTEVQPHAGAVAVRDGVIIFVGDDADAEAYTGNDTEVIDLAGRLLLPGIVDAHLHPLGGSVKELFQCNFPFSATPDDIRDTVAGCVTADPEAIWITGGQWDSAFFDRFDIASPRRLLDEVAPDTAIVLSDDSGHNAWVNSKALELAGITAETPDPAGGSILREEDGAPNGVLLETAQGLVYKVVPPFTGEQFLDAANWFSKTANAFGITAIKAAAIEEAEIRAFRAADDNGTLSVRVATAFRTPYGHREEPLDYAEIDRIRDAYASPLVDTRFVKIFLDGVPTPARTASMLEPYVPDAEHGENFNGPPLHVDEALLTRDLIELDRRGYTVKIHTAGDRSVRDALDAIEATREANGNRDRRHELAHAGYIHEDDIGRFAELNVVADFSPVIWHPSPIINAVIAAVGPERGREYWPVRDLLDAGAPVLAGSDWPSAVPDANPWVGIEAFVTRRDPRGETPGALWPEQAITLAEAIEIYTRHGARALRLEDKIGTIETGKLADLIVLDRNLFEVPIEDVGDTLVDITIFSGRVVHQRDTATIAQQQVAQ